METVPKAHWKGCYQVPSTTRTAVEFQGIDFLDSCVCRCCSVAKSRPTLCSPTDCSTPGFPVLHSLPECAQFMSIELVMPSNHLILCSPLLLLPSIFPSIRVFHNASALHITGPNYWSFSFSISPFKEYSGLISFQIDWFDLLAVQGTLKIVSNTIVQKHQFFSAQLSLRFNSYIHMRLLEES